MMNGIAFKPFRLDIFIFSHPPGNSPGLFIRRGGLKPFGLLIPCNKILPENCNLPWMQVTVSRWAATLNLVGRFSLQLSHPSTSSG